MLVLVARGSRWFMPSGVVLLLLALAPGKVFAQPDKMGTKANVEEPFRKLQQKIDKYVTGETQASGPTDKEAMEAAGAASRWFVNRLTWWDLQATDREYLPKV